jgi:gas vesicle protein
MDNSKNTGKIIGSLVIGALAGAALGVLFAPKKGSKTRRKIANDTEDLVNDFKKKLSRQAKDFKKNVKNEAVTLKHKAEEFEQLVENKVETVASNLKEKANAFLHMNSDHTIK